MNKISQWAYIHPEASIGDGNEIGPFCYIDRNTVIGDNNIIHNNVTLHYGARIGSGNEIMPYASLATKPQDLKFRGEDSTCEIGDSNSIREYVTVSRGTVSKGRTIIGSNNLLMENVHVAHDCLLGNNLIIGNATKFAGEIVVDDNAVISAAVLVHQFCHIAGHVMIQGGCRFSQDIPPYVLVGKFPVKYCGLNVVGLTRHGFTKEQIDAIHDAYRLLYSKGIMAEGIEEIKRNMELTPEIQYIIDFVESSKRGVIR